MEVQKKEEADVLIVGAGVVGCAVARTLAFCFPDKVIAVLEKNTECGMETSGRNSGVLHSGLHHPPDSLRAKLARRGHEMARNYAKNKKLPLLECGMIIAVSWKSVWDGLYKEWRDLWRLMRQGKTQKIDFEFLTPLGLKILEPNLHALSGIFIPGVSVVDPTAFVRSLQKDAAEFGVKFYFGEPANSILQNKNYHLVWTPRRCFKTRTIVNCAGLYADRIAMLSEGFSDHHDAPLYKVEPWRGEYYEVIGPKKDLTRRLIYPAMPANSPGKGIHFGPRPDGRLFLGPNARLVPHRECYEEDKTPSDVFLSAARRFFPQLRESDLRWSHSGIRPKIHLPGNREADFVIRAGRDKPPIINLIGIESPGLAASMAIAEYVAEIYSKLA